MGWVAYSAILRLHLAQRGHVDTKFLYSAGSVAEDVVPREHGVFFFEHKAHVVVRVAWRVHCTDGGAFNAKDLAVRDGLLAFARRVFVDSGGEVWIEAKKFGNPAGVITVPVG